MTLRERLLKALEFDATRYPPFSWVGLVNKLRTASYAYKMGIEEEIKRRKPLDLALADVVEALELAMNHPAEGHTYCVFCGVADKVDHHGCCEGDAALAKLDEALKGVEK